MKNNWHIYPTNDLKPHQLEGKYCECSPTIEMIKGGYILIHRSYDRRENKEVGAITADHFQ